VTAFVLVGMVDVAQEPKVPERRRATVDPVNVMVRVAPLPRAIAA
jgi:hypothetical protein